jgi:prepilin peptidase CpaA
MYNSPDSIIIVSILGIMAVAVCTDLRSRKIPNRLTYSAMVLMVAYYSMAYGLEGCWFSLKGLLLGTGILFPVYLLGGMGAGDAKLMGVVGAALGVQGVITAFLFAALIGGVCALVIILFRYEQCRDLLQRSALMIKGLVYSKRFYFIPEKNGTHAPKLCYALPIAVGTVGAVVWHQAYSSYLL